MGASGKGQSDTISPEQVRAARALLDWTREQLSEACGVRIQTLYRFERSQTHPHRRTATTIRRALELAGVQFIDPDGAGGPGVRLAHSPEREHERTRAHADEHERT